MNIPLDPDNLATANQHPIATWPGFDFTNVFHHGHVVTCEEAAAARGIPIEFELKSIILKTGIGAVAVHLPADRRLHSARIKSALLTRRTRFASAEELEDFGLRSGLVNPGNTGFCERHLICRSLFERSFVTTNAGTFTAGVAFDPADLLSLPNHIVGDYSHG